ncbi:hypothetical protein [Occallatibacter savannae]|uniref:hypothetical protein n=1 Tax=Occallatibacter savannae TaxID=1002691 RepID=UPI0013A596E6|nr:hypothetical protein [Occallatibacter savannae]
MTRSLSNVLVGLLGLAYLTAPALAQSQEVKPKPPMYSYVANWQVARANWPDLEKSTAPIAALMQKSVDDGTLVGYGDDTTLVHTADGATNDTWWSSMSLAGIIKVLEQARTSTDPHSAALNTAKHWDHLWVSRYYNWKPGSKKGAYTWASDYKLKESASNDDLDDLSQRFIVPLLEKLFADGHLIEYEIDTLAVHTNAPGEFSIVMIAPTPEDLDVVRAAISAAGKEHPLALQAFGSLTEGSGHRDDLAKTNATFK